MSLVLKSEGLRMLGFGTYELVDDAIALAYYLLTQQVPAKLRNGRGQRMVIEVLR